MSVYRPQEITEQSWELNRLGMHCSSYPFWSSVVPLQNESNNSSVLLILLWQINEVIHIKGLPQWRSGKESACQCRMCKRCRFDPWVGKIPWRRKWQLTPVLFPRESHGQRSLVGYSPSGHKRVRHDLGPEQQQWPVKKGTASDWDRSSRKAGPEGRAGWVQWPAFLPTPGYADCLNCSNSVISAVPVT